ncbi:Multiple RNA-binding domain-containing protein 1 [Serendipita sp. 405]|nr:Multiple RNA-binding domain-containing protein 1 [Serendipita sp. 405]
MGVKRGVGPSWANEEVENPGASAAAAAISSRLKNKKKADDAVDKENEREEATADQGEVSDMEWMRRRMRASQVDDNDMREEKMFEQSDEDEDDRMQGVEKTAQEPKAQQPTEEVSSDPTRDAILSNGRLFVRNLAFSCTEQELSTHFATFGDIEQVHLPVDTSSNPKGFGYIRFKNPSHALAAYEALDKASFQGRLLHILPGVDRHPKPVEGIGGDPTQPTRLKDVRAQKRKEKSGKEFNWAVLYMNSDAVANSIADRLGIPKADILNPDASGVGGSPAVKLALAETHIIVETKKYLEQNNVDLSLFAQKRLPRSKTIILVKNIPYGVASSEIEGLFKAYGSVRRVLFPPAGTIAIVEFAEGNEKQAADAWRGVAYKRVKDSILYLEWAPQGLLDGPTPDTINDDEKRPKSFVERRLENATMSSSSAKKVNVTNEDEGGGGDEEDAAPGATLHIGNLSFATTSERLSSIFRHLPFFAFAKVATKVDPNRPGEKLSQGFGFVGFKTVDAAKQAMKGVSAGGEGGLVLDGHVLKISFAGRGKEEMEKEKSGAGILGQSGKTKGTKVIVKNLAFEVTKKELWELFKYVHFHMLSLSLSLCLSVSGLLMRFTKKSAHGQVKSVRLPNRADRRSRGFAFVDFASRKEAENAMEQLRHSHLLGRHLVLDWAKKEQDVDEVRLKTMLEYASASRGGDMGRKEKLRLGATEDATESDNE